MTKKNDVRKVALADGEYWAMCRERNVLSATANGYGHVFPNARMVVKDGWAVFYRDDLEVWNCNAAYAAIHFDLQPV
jgi:hypothetical protein